MSTDSIQPQSSPTLREGEYHWNELIQMVLSHRRKLVAANLIAVLVWCFIQIDDDSVTLSG
ncbi:MAG: hypothetical protein P8179_09760 [Candidatus Thiodiazotropha sp.]